MAGEEIPVVMNRWAGQRSGFALALEKLFLRARAISEAGSWPPERIEKAVLGALEKEGLRVRAFFTEGPGDAVGIAKRLSQEGKRLVIAAGGDGTVNEVVNGIAGSSTALGIIPLGTANSLALELGIPFSIAEACRVVARGRVARIDLGRAGQRFFAMGAGMSFDAHVIQKITPRFKRLFGGAGYLLRGVLEALSYSFPELEVEAEGVSGRRTGSLAIVGNARFYGGYFRPTPHAKLDDGLLDILVMKRRRIWNLLGYLWAMRTGDVTQLPDVEYFQCRRVRVVSDPPVPIHVDAEIEGKTPCEFECIPAALSVIVPN